MRNIEIRVSQESSFSIETHIIIAIVIPIADYSNIPVIPKGYRG